MEGEKLPIVSNFNQKLRAKRSQSQWIQLKRLIQNGPPERKIDEAKLLEVCNDEINAFQRAIERYESSSGADPGEVASIIEAMMQIQEVLIRSRMVCGWSQTEFARNNRLRPEQVSRYERTGYAGIRLGKAVQIMETMAAALRMRKRQNAMEKNTSKAAEDSSDEAESPSQLPGEARSFAPPAQAQPNSDCLPGAPEAVEVRMN